MSPSPLYPVQALTHACSHVPQITIPVGPDSAFKALEPTPGAGVPLRIAVANGLGNAKKLIKGVADGSMAYDFIEVGGQAKLGQGAWHGVTAARRARPGRSPRLASGEGCWQKRESRVTHAAPPAASGPSVVLSPQRAKHASAAWRTAS